MRIESSRSGYLPGNHLCKGAARSRRVRSCRQDVPQRSVRKGMERAEAVSQRAAHCRIAAVGGDEPLLQGGIAGIAGRLLFILGRNRDSVLFEDVQHVREHGMDDETVVIVEMEDGSVAVPAVADIPVHEAGQGVIDGGAFVFAGEFQQGRLNHCGEEQPVTLVRLYPPRRFEGADEILLRFGVQTVPKCVRSADQALCNESGVH